MSYNPPWSTWSAVTRLSGGRASTAAVFHLQAARWAGRRAADWTRHRIPSIGAKEAGGYAKLAVRHYNAALHLLDRVTAA